MVRADALKSIRQCPFIHRAFYETSTPTRGATKSDDVTKTTYPSVLTCGIADQSVCRDEGCASETDVSAKRDARNARGDRAHAHDHDDDDDDDAMARGCVDVDVVVSTAISTATDDARARAGVVHAAVRGGSETTVRARRGRRRAL